MTRDLSHFDKRIFDVLIIGGGIYGSCVAWEASLRGLTVGLVEKGDFGGATSANSLKIIHGGLRYLQHLDIRRLRESTRERTILMNIAPHLVHPLPVIIPTYGHGISGKEIMSVALLVNHMLSADCKRSWDPDKSIPWGRVISKQEITELLPNIPRQGLTGGVLFYDAQVYNSERLVLAFLHSASQEGAVLANYLEVKSFLIKDGRVSGVLTQDRVSGDTLHIRSKMVVNTSGPWGGELLANLNGKAPHPALRLAKAINIIVNTGTSSFAYGVPAAWGNQDPRSVVKRSNRLLFIAPWRNHSIIGTTYSHFKGRADEVRATKEEIQALVGTVNESCPGMGLVWDNVKFVHKGLLPCTEDDSNLGDPQLLSRFQIQDYRDQGIDGLLSVVGVKYTTARMVAQRVINRVCQLLAFTPAESKSDHVPVYGGAMERFQTFVNEETPKAPSGIPSDSFLSLLKNYGSAYPKVLQDLAGWGEGRIGLGCGEQDILKAQIRFAVREEMAQKLSDVVLRRTDIGSIGHPGPHVLKTCAREMACELQWNEQRLAQEVLETEGQFVLNL